MGVILAFVPLLVGVQLQAQGPRLCEETWVADYAADSWGAWADARSLARAEAAFGRIGGEFDGPVVDAVLIDSFAALQATNSQFQNTESLMAEADETVAIANLTYRNPAIMDDQDRRVMLMQVIRTLAEGSAVAFRGQLQLLHTVGRELCGLDPGRLAELMPDPFSELVESES